MALRGSTRAGRFWIAVLGIGGLGALFAFAAWLDLFGFLHDLSLRYADWHLGALFCVLLLLVPVVPVLLADARTRLRALAREVEAARAEVEAAGLRDPDTRLANRRHLNARLSRLLANADPATSRAPTLALIDLDKFRQVNDGEGHDVADLVLRSFARRLTPIEGPGRTAFRLGGNEFALLYAGGADEADIAALTETVQRSSRMPLEIRGHGLRISCSLGIAHGKAADTPVALMRKADQALASAKRDGGGACVVFDPRLDKAMELRARLEAGLAQAVENGEIIPHFQPIVDLRTGRVYGAEVLARWHNDALGWIPPDDFVQLAEDMGLILPLTWGLLRRALGTTASWTRTPLISFNISPLMFRDADLIDHVARTLKDSGFPPGQLQIEITESAVVTDLDRARDILTGFRDLGVGLALDDFGTGHSSLTTLSALPFTQLKIDQSFVMGLDTDPRKATIARSVAGLAQGLGLKVTAEGIETQEERDFIAAIGCDYGQGYLFSRPLPPGEFTALVASDVSFATPPITDTGARA